MFVKTSNVLINSFWILLSKFFELLLNCLKISTILFKLVDSNDWFAIELFCSWYKDILSFKDLICSWNIELNILKNEEKFFSSKIFLFVFSFIIVISWSNFDFSSIEYIFIFF